MNAPSTAVNLSAPFGEAVHSPGRERAEGSERGTIDVRLEEFEGGVGFWGAVPASYDTTSLPMDRGIHVHARSICGKAKHIDRSYSAVRIFSSLLPHEGLIVSEVEAIYYMVSTVFGIAPQNILCPKCGSSHLDQDWYSVHPHCEHDCAKCGERFKSVEPAVGNPVAAVRELCGLPKQRVEFSKKRLQINQSRFRNGLLIWGSNPAFLWTGRHAEQEGMHVHVFGKSADVPELDETYGTVRIDGIEVDPQMVRLLMAQQSLPMLRDQIASINCPKCDAPQFDTGANAYTPTKVRRCSACGDSFSLESAVVSNPVLATFKKMEKFAQREPQRCFLDLPPYRPTAA